MSINCLQLATNLPIVCLILNFSAVNFSVKCSFGLVPVRTSVCPAQCPLCLVSVRPLSVRLRVSSTWCQLGQVSVRHEMSVLSSIRSPECPFNIVAVGPSFRSTSCPFGLVSIWTSVCSAKCQFGLVSVRTSVDYAKRKFDLVSVRPSIRSVQSPFGQVSVRPSVRSEWCTYGHAHFISPLCTIVPTLCTNIIYHTMHQRYAPTLYM